MKPEDLSLLAKFTKSKARYAPQSQTVQGILKDMYDTFSSDLESSTHDEASANRKFESFIATKMAQLRQMQAIKEKKEAQKTEAETQLAQTTESYDDTEAQMKADVDFFDATKAACDAKHEEWTIRSDLRDDELQGIADALAILTSDEARELFDKSIKAGKETHVDDSYDSGVDITPVSLLQIEGDASSGANVMKAYDALKSQASKVNSMRLAALAAQLRETQIGHFDAVLIAIDNMMTALKEENTADIAKRDQCKDEYKSTESVISDVNWLIKNNVAKIDKLESMIEKRTQEKEETIALIAETQAQMRAMAQERKEQNQAFLNSKADDTAALGLLTQARDVLSKYYNKNDIRWAQSKAK